MSNQVCLLDFIHAIFGRNSFFILIAHIACDTDHIRVRFEQVDQVGYLLLQVWRDFQQLFRTKSQFCFEL